MDADGSPAAEADRWAGATFRLHRGLPPIGPAADEPPRRCRTRSAHAAQRVPGRLVPRGVISTEPLKETVGRASPGDWIEHPGLWVVACDY